MMGKIENSEIFNYGNLSYKYGIALGVVLSLVLLLFRIASIDSYFIVNVTAYLIFSFGIVLFLNTLKKHTSHDIFIRGIGAGSKLSLIAGLILVVVNIVLFFTNKGLSFSKYGLKVSTSSELAIISAALFFETFVFGSLITFAILQFIKGRYKNAEH